MDLGSNSETNINSKEIAKSFSNIWPVVSNGITIISGSPVKFLKDICLNMKGKKGDEHFNGYAQET